MKQRLIKVTDDQIKQCFDNGNTLHQAAVILTMTPVSVWRRAKALGLKWSDNKASGNKKILLKDILEGKFPEYQTFKLKHRLLAEGVKKNVCEECGIVDWNGKELVMQLDHIDGVPHNHLLSNLRLLCPNCHAQTDTWCGKSK